MDHEIAKKIEELEARRKPFFAPSVALRVLRDPNLLPSSRAALPRFDLNLPEKTFQTPEFVKVDLKDHAHMEEMMLKLNQDCPHHRSLR